MRYILLVFLGVGLCTSLFAGHEPGICLVALKPANAGIFNGKTFQNAAFESLEIAFPILSVSPRFPGHTGTPKGIKNAVDLSLIFQIRFAPEKEVEQLCKQLMKTGLFRYAEPNYLPEPLFTPNDTLLGLQYHIPKIKAPEAWDLNQGDTNVVVGITDTGIDLFHPDLVGNIKRNYLDQPDNIDNDADGYIDNFQGWDLGENDNLPQCNANFHGLHVAGISSATTNNLTGVAGTGFKCKMLPIKISNASGSLTHAYDGIVYAADHGCQIINCSWGGTGGGQYGQDIVNYATFNTNSLVIAAAGNNGNDELFFPASYENVLSVAATDQNDHKKQTSSYGIRVDVSAPGEDMYSTWVNGGYTPSGGTSTAAPAVAGAAGIVKSFFPSYSALQIGEQLKVTSDVVDTVPFNLPYSGMLGKGRINLLRALTETNHPGLVITHDSISDNNNLSLEIGDTLRLFTEITNYLQPTAGNVTMLVRSPSAFLQALDSTASLPALGTLQSSWNANDPFSFIILPGTPINFELDFRVELSDSNGFITFDFVRVMVNVDYLNIQVNQVATTATSKGAIGYNASGTQQGLGFVYENQNLLYEAGLLIGVSSTRVSDCVRGTGAFPDQDFQALQRIIPVNPPQQSDFETFASFNDSSSQNPIPVRVIQKTYASTQAGLDRFVVFEYDIINTGTAAIDSLFAGLFADWDIQNSGQNKSETNAANKMGFTFSTQSGGYYAGIQVLSWDAPFNHYAIDNVSGGAGGINLFDGFTGAEKLLALKTARSNAGQGSGGNDVCDVVSAGPYALNPGDTIQVSFALLAANNLNDLISAASNAQNWYGSAPVGSLSEKCFDKFRVFPNPAGEFLFFPPQKGNIVLTIYSVAGTMIETHVLKEGTASISIAHLPAGLYFIDCSQENAVHSVKFVKR